ncbi:MAG: transglycosylase SLT domain-containing protein [Gemmatimonadota bacterium]
MPAAAAPTMSMAAGSHAEVPDSARTALAQGRYFRAATIMRAYLRPRADSLPVALLTAAEAEAGWGDWAEVERLLDGRAWLDTAEGARGWHLLGRARLATGNLAGGRAALGRYLELAADTDATERGLAELRRARAAARAQDHEAARMGYERAAALLPAAAGWMGVLAAEASAATGDTAAVRVRLDALDRELAWDWAWRTRVRAYSQAEDADAAVAAALDAAGRLATAGARAEALAVAGETQLAHGDSAAARRTFLRILEDGRGTAAGVTAARHLGELGNLDVRQRLAVGETWLRHGNAARARPAIEAYLATDLGSPQEREELRLALGRGLFNAGEYGAAEPLLTGVAERQVLSASVRAEALYTAARARYRAGGVAEARRTLGRVAERFPGQDGAARALYLLADLDQDDGRFEAAERNFRQATAVPADVEQVGFSWMRLGGLMLERGRPVEALGAFEGYRSAFPTGRRWQQATYWAALIHTQQGDSATARGLLSEVRARDPFSYYGGQAAELLGVAVLDVPLAAAPPRDPALEERLRAGFAAVDLLRRAGLDAEAAFELERVRRRFAADPAHHYALAEALIGRGASAAGIALAWDIYRREGAWNPRLLRIVYPFPFRDIVVAEAEERGVDPFLAAALIRQESMFNPRALSPAGAIGLMQIMPETGATLARGSGVRRFDPDMLRRGEFNVHLGMRYLAEQLAEYEGRLPIVLSAYNAGPTRVKRWRTFPEFDHDERFTERIPFTETRDYVKIVQQNARMYRALYMYSDVGTTPGNR